MVGSEELAHAIVQPKPHRHHVSPVDPNHEIGSHTYTNFFDELLLDMDVPSKCVFTTFGKGDGGKYVCMIPDLFESENCWIMSIGSHGDFNFETDVIAKTKCHVHTFDCTGTWTVPPGLQSRCTLHKKCIGSTYTSRQEYLAPHSVRQVSIVDPKDFLRYEELVAIATTGNNFNRFPTVLKMDIEGGEFHVLPDILSGSPELYPAQIAVELHLKTYFNASSEYAVDKTNGQWHIKDLSQAKGLMQKLRKSGFKVIHREDNPSCAHCSEVVLMKSNLIPAG